MRLATFLAVACVTSCISSVSFAGSGDTDSDPASGAKNTEVNAEVSADVAVTAPATDNPDAGSAPEQAKAASAPGVIAGITRRPRSKAELCDAAIAIAIENNLPAHFFTRLIEQESGFNTEVVSRAGAQGIAQFMPRTASSRGLLNPFAAVPALAASAKFLNELAAQFGNYGLAAAAYNAGPQRVRDWIAGRGGLPSETRHYVYTITGHPVESWVWTPSQIALATASKCGSTRMAHDDGQVQKPESETQVSATQISATQVSATQVSVEPRMAVATAEDADSRRKRFERWLRNGVCARVRCIAVGQSTPSRALASAARSAARLDRSAAARPSSSGRRRCPPGVYCVIAVGHSTPSRPRQSGPERQTKAFAATRVAG